MSGLGFTDDSYGGSRTGPPIRPEDLQPNETVAIVLMEETYDGTYLKELQDRNAKAEKEAEAKFKKYEPEMPNHKDGGVTWKCAVVRRGITEEEPKGVSTFLNDEEGKMIAPDYSVAFYLSQPPWPIVFAKKKPSYAFGRDKCGKNPELPEVSKPPSSWPVKDFKTGVTVDTIPAGEEVTYAGLIDRENDRIKRAQKLIDQHKASSIELAGEHYRSLLSRRALAYKKLDNGFFSYSKLEKGLILIGKINRKKTGFYFDIKFTAWDSKNKRWMIYQQPLRIKTILSLAEEVQVALASQIEQRIEAKAIKEAKAEVEAEDKF